MNILLNIAYNTAFGEELVLNVINGRENGADVVTPYRMSTSDGKVWTYSLKLDAKTGEYIDYYYSVVRGESNVVRKEWTVAPHRLELGAAKGGRIVAYDRWIGIPDNSYLYSSAFTDCIKRRRLSVLPPSDHVATLRIKVRAPQLRGHERLVLVGNEVTLGTWDVFKGQQMYEHNYNEWVADINALKISGKTIEFKFVAVDVADTAEILWEDRFNRTIDVPVMERTTSWCMNSTTLSSRYTIYAAPEPRCRCSR